MFTLKLSLVLKLECFHTTPIQVPCVIFSLCRVSDHLSHRIGPRFSIFWIGSCHQFGVWYWYYNWVVIFVQYEHTGTRFIKIDCRIKSGHPILVEVSARRPAWWQSPLTGAMAEVRWRASARVWGLKLQPRFGWAILIWFIARHTESNLQQILFYSLIIQLSLYSVLISLAYN